MGKKTKKKHRKKNERFSESPRPPKTSEAQASFNRCCEKKK